MSIASVPKETPTLKISKMSPQRRCLYDKVDTWASYPNRLIMTLWNYRPPSQSVIISGVENKSQKSHFPTNCTFKCEIFHIIFHIIFY